MESALAAFAGPLRIKQAIDDDGAGHGRTPTDAPISEGVAAAIFGIELASWGGRGLPGWE